MQPWCSAPLRYAPGKRGHIIRTLLSILAAVYFAFKIFIYKNKIQIEQLDICVFQA